jgi:hypothetical protein
VSWITFATPPLPPACVSAGHSTVEPLFSFQMPPPLVPTDFSRNFVKFSVVPDPSERWTTVRLPESLASGLSALSPGRPVLIGAGRSSHHLGGEVELVDAVEVVRHRDRSDHRREVQELAALVLGVVLLLHQAVGAGEVDELLLEVGAALAGAAAAVGHRGVGVGVLELDDGFVVEALGERGTRAVDGAGDLLARRRGGAVAWCLGGALGLAVTAAAGRSEDRQAEHDGEHAEEAALRGSQRITLFVRPLY